MSAPIPLFLIMALSAAASASGPLMGAAAAPAAPLGEALSLFHSMGIGSAMVVVAEKSGGAQGVLGHSWDMSLVVTERTGLERVTLFPSGIVVFLPEDSNGVEDLAWLGHLPVLKNVIFIGGDAVPEQWEFPYSLHFLAYMPNSTNRRGCWSQFVVHNRLNHGGTNHIASYKDGRYRFRRGADKTMFARAFKVCTNFEGKTFPAVAFKLFPYSMPDFNISAGHSGYEYKIAEAIVDGLNLKMALQQPSMGGMWGYQVPPGSGNFTGLKLF